MIDNVVFLGARLTEADSVTLQGMDLLAAGGLVVLGVVTSTMVGKVVPTAPRVGTKPADQRLPIR